MKGYSLIFLYSLLSSHTMFPNTSEPLQNIKSSKNEEATTIDIDEIMDNVSIVLYTLTIVIGVIGNSMVVWVAGFKLKVDNVLQKYFLN